MSNHQPYASLRVKNFRLYLPARLTVTLGFQMQSVIVGWQVYEITHDVLSLGLIGLAEAIPFICTALFAGHAADIIDRKKIILISTLCLLIGTLTLFTASLNINSHTLVIIYIAIGTTGITRSFLGPSFFALLPQIMPRNLYTNASTWSSSVWHVGAVIGPAMAGILYAMYGAAFTYAISASLLFLSLFFVVFIKPQQIPKNENREPIFASIASGIKFVFKNQLILSALSLDLFAVLFGGAVALLPAFADQILKCGPEGLGILRAAPSIGAVLMALIVIYFSIEKNTGWILIGNVALFGVCMIAFALSENFYLSFVILLLSGAFDNISVITRGTILQLMTPDEMRGRVSSVNSIFIGSSNEIGGFESGLAAKLMRLVPSVVFGGIMTLGVVGFITLKAPQLRKFSIKDVK